MACDLITRPTEDLDLFAAAPASIGTVRLTTYFATLADGEPRATEHAELRWIPVHDLRSLEWAPADVPAVERVMQLLGQ